MEPLALCAPPWEVFPNPRALKLGCAAGVNADAVLGLTAARELRERCSLCCHRRFTWTCSRLQPGSEQGKVQAGKEGRREQEEVNLYHLEEAQGETRPESINTCSHRNKGRELFMASEGRRTRSSAWGRNKGSLSWVWSKRRAFGVSGVMEKVPHLLSPCSLRSCFLPLPSIALQQPLLFPPCMLAGLFISKERQWGAWGDQVAPRTGALSPGVCQHCQPAAQHKSSLMSNAANECLPACIFLPYRII